MIVKGPVKKTPTLFLCHSHRDKRFARRLARNLYELGISVWIDDWRLAVGDSLHACVGKALEDSAYVGVVLSPDSMGSRWCQDELDQALTREKRLGRKLVLPLLYRRIRPPGFLESRVYLNFSASYWLALTQLGGFLHGLDQQLVFEHSAKNRPASVRDVQATLHESGLAPGVPVPEHDYRELSRIFKKAGVSIPHDRVRLVLLDSPRGDIFLDDIMTLPKAMVRSMRRALQQRPGLKKRGSEGGAQDTRRKKARN